MSKEAQEKIMVKIAQSVIANQLALNFNEELKGTKFYKQELKNALNKLNPILVKAEVEEYDKMFERKEKDTVSLYDVVNELTTKLSELGIEHFLNISKVLDYYKTNPEKLQNLLNEK